jgi:hypothetical protein
MLNQLPRLSLLATALMTVLYSAPASAQATRTWVSGVGDDMFPCSRTAPCKTFAGAMSKTAANGEIDCLDPGGFGAVTVNKSITIDCNGTLGHILATLGVSGVTINTAGVNVVLRNLSINGAATGSIGVRLLQGNSLTLENVHIANFNGGSGIGVQFAPNTANAVLLVSNSVIRSNGVAPATGGGILVQPAVGGTNALAVIHNSNIQRNGGSGILVNTASASATVTVRDSTISNNTNGGVRSVATSTAITLLDRVTLASNSVAGISSENANSTVRVGNSVIHANALGAQLLAGGILRSYKNNDVIANGGGEGPFTQENLQ